MAVKQKNACYLLQPTSLWAFDEVYEQSELNAVRSPSSQWVCCVIFLFISSFVIYTKKTNPDERRWAALGGKKLTFTIKRELICVNVKIKAQFQLLFTENRLCPLRHISAVTHTKVEMISFNNPVGSTVVQQLLEAR